MAVWFSSISQAVVPLLKGALDGIPLLVVHAILQDDDPVVASSFAAPVRLCPPLQPVRPRRCCSLSRVGEVNVSTGQFTRLLRLGFFRVWNVAACDCSTRGLDLCRGGSGDAIGHGRRELAGRQAERGLCWLAVGRFGRGGESSIRSSG